MDKITEFKIELNILLISIIGFLIALIWRDLIMDVINKTFSKTNLVGRFIFTSVSSVILIYILVHFRKEHRKNRYQLNGNNDNGELDDDIISE